MSGGAGGAAGPSTASGQSAFDSSGWNVNFGEGSITSSAGSGVSQYLPYIALGVGLLIVWRMTRKQ